MEMLLIWIVVRYWTYFSILCIHSCQSFLNYLYMLFFYIPAPELLVRIMFSYVLSKRQVICTWKVEFSLFFSVFSLSNKRAKKLLKMILLQFQLKAEKNELLWFMAVACTWGILVITAKLHLCYARERYRYLMISWLEEVKLQIECLMLP